MVRLLDAGDVCRFEVDKYEWWYGPEGSEKSITLSDKQLSVRFHLHLTLTILTTILSLPLIEA